MVVAFDDEKMLSCRFVISDLDLSSQPPSNSLLSSARCPKTIDGYRFS